MNAEVYYFTGTGNSLAVAKELSQKLRTENTDAVLVPVPSAIRKAAVKPEAEIVGIVFPVYYIDLPNMVKAFAAKLEGLEDKYIFAVATYGGGKTAGHA